MGGPGIWTHDSHMMLSSLVFEWNSNNILFIVSATLIWSFLTSRNFPVPVNNVFKRSVGTFGWISCIEEILPAGGDTKPITRDPNPCFPEDGMVLAAVSFEGWVSGFILWLLGYWILQLSYLGAHLGFLRPSGQSPHALALLRPFWSGEWVPPPFALLCSLPSGLMVLTHLAFHIPGLCFCWSLCLEDRFCPRPSG